MSKKENRFYVYGHIRTDIMGIFYIGLGSNDRMHSKHHRNAHWHNVFNKCNGNLRLVVFKKNITFEEAVELEIHYIKEYGRHDLGKGILVNKTDGGEGFKNIIVTTEKAKRCAIAISKALKEKYKHCEHHNKGIPLSEEHKKKTSDSLKKLYASGYKRKNETPSGAKHWQCKGDVYQYCKETGILIAIYKSTGLAEKATGVHSGRISEVINGKRSHAKGFIFKRLD